MLISPYLLLPESWYHNNKLKDKLKGVGAESIVGNEKTDLGNAKLSMSFTNNRIKFCFVYPTFYCLNHDIITTS